MFKLVGQGDAESLAELLKDPTLDISVQDENGNTALIMSAEGEGECVRLLINAGSSLDHTNHEGAGALDTAINYQDEDIVRQLMAAGALITMNEYVDIIVPRGGKSLIERIAADASVPVIKHLDGVCHVFVDRGADLDKAVAIAFNAKTYRYGICGAMESLLVERTVAAEFLPRIAEQFRDAGVEIRGCAATCALLSTAKAATTADWYEEYLAPIIAIRVLDDIDAAMAHIRDYGSGHTDAIVTENWNRARRFLAEVDSSSVMVNAPTCFADGFEYSLGAEIGISTDKLHARGPVGLEGLTTQKFIVLGDGQTR